jgi:hypothetical protein
MKIEDLAERLRAKKTGSGWMARCPAHGDTSPSLSLRRGRAGRILLHCFAGDTPQEIAGAIGVAIAELLHEAPAGRPAPVRPRSMADRLLAEALSQKWVRHLEEYQTADEIRGASKLIQHTRQQATTRGLALADEATWDLLAMAAAAEREVLALEAAL